MSRLIDADKLLDDMKNELEKAVNDENLDKADCMVIMTSAIALKDFVNRQPTAYDVDKVVEQLGKQVYEIDDSLSLSARDVIDEEDVFEIVKAGGKCKTNMCIDCSMATYSQGRPYCEKEERHLDSFSYKPDWCSLKAGGSDEN